MFFIHIYLISLVVLILLNLQGLLEELRHSLVYTTLELEATIVSAKEEITRKECELIHANDLLSRVIKERDEARAKCEKLMLEKQDLHQIDNKSGSENEQQVCLSEKHSTPSDEYEEINTQNSITSPNGSSTSPTTQFEAVLQLAEKKALPEKGKLLKAVVEAGPLLQTLLLAGPLPQWQHPPPQLNSIEIPPVSISSQNPSLLCKKRDFQLSSPSVSSKCRKIIQQLPTTPTTASNHFLPHPSFS